MSQYIQSNYMVNLPSPAAASLLNTISATDSGKTLVLAQNAIQTFTLPAAQVGLRYSLHLRCGSCF